MSLLFLIPAVSALVLASPKAPKHPGTGTCVLEGTFKVKKADGKPAVPEYAQVYVETSSDVPRRKPTTLEMIQKDRQFDPRFLVVQTDDTVVFINQDSEAHEVHANQAVNMFDGKRETSAVRTDGRPFPAVGRTKIGCKIHPGMSAVILTVPNDLHVGIDPVSGGFQLSGLPRRQLKVAFWAEGAVLEVRELSPCNAGRLDVVAERAPPDSKACYGCRPEYN